MPVDFQRRKSVMSRSLRLGHCVCNPKQPCPCDTFQTHNVCSCAGERMPVASGPVALTKYVSKAGCASKIPQAELLRILGNLPAMPDPNVLLGAAAGDDAAIYRLDDERCLVLTVDVFTPVVNDPFLFGQIAAANSLSDVYAMGGRPIAALSIVGFPIEELDGSVLEAILRGGIAKLAEAGCPLVGGHSINDGEIKCGFAVTGLIETGSGRNRLPTCATSGRNGPSTCATSGRLGGAVARDSARPGDALVLTKPLGTGMLSFAAQIGRLDESVLNEAGAFMATLNKDAAELMVKHGANACTDVTGFGLAGHLVEMTRRTGVTAEIDLARLPVFAAARDCLDQEILPGAVERNQEYAMAWVKIEDASSEKDLPILYDPQTSGGLLVSLPAAQAEAYVEELRGRGHEGVAIIGRILEKNGNRPEGEVIVVNSRLENFIGKRPATMSIDPDPAAPARNGAQPLSCSSPAGREGARESASASAEPCCCVQEPAEKAAPDQSVRPAEEKADTTVRPILGAVPATASAFTDFMKAANAEGLLDARTKKLMGIALSVAQRCRPCLELHIKAALAMGLTKPEIEEAAWLGIAFAGSPSMMMYREVCLELQL
jgi:selenide,water dikinase